MPEADALPIPKDDYFEIECAKLHGGWPRWAQLPDSTRGWLMAHELEKNMRDHYYFDARQKSGAGGAEKPPGKSVADLIRERWQGKPRNKAEG